MENQHRKIKGYRELDQDEIDLMNKIKDLAIRCDVLCTELYDAPTTDPRWQEDGTMMLQKGFMSLVRSVAKPTIF